MQAQVPLAHQGEVDAGELLPQVGQRPALVTWVAPQVLPAALLRQASAFQAPRALCESPRMSLQCGAEAL